MQRCGARPPPHFSAAQGLPEAGATFGLCPSSVRELLSSEMLTFVRKHITGCKGCDSKFHYLFRVKTPPLGLICPFMSTGSLSFVLVNRSLVSFATPHFNFTKPYQISLCHLFYQTKTTQLFTHYVKITLDFWSPFYLALPFQFCVHSNTTKAAGDANGRDTWWTSTVKKKSEDSTLLT